MTLILAACGGGGSNASPSASPGEDNPSVVIATVPPASPTPELVGPYGVIGEVHPEYGPATQLTGMVYPIPGGCLPQGSQLMPNAPRPYRDGTHEGIDFYHVDNCTTIVRGTTVVASHDGVVIRADHDYVNPTPDEMNALLADPYSGEALDRFRGMQVWIDHGGGIVTRYSHLDAIVPEVRAGERVQRGQHIAYVGESGTPDSVFRPHAGNEYHLHWELRVGDTFIGDGLPPAEVRQIYLTLFSE